MILDIIVIALIVLGAFMGYQKGLVGVLTNLAGLILAFLLAFLLQTPVSNALKETGLSTTLNTAISTGINKAIDNRKSNKEIDKQNFYDSIVNSALSQDDTSKLTDSVVTLILKGISFIGIFIIVMIIVYILKNILNLVFELPILASINNIGGFAVGGLVALLRILLILAIVYFLSPIPLFENSTKFVENSKFTNELYKNNIIVKIIK